MLFIGRIQLLMIGLLLGAFFLTLIFWRVYELGRANVLIQAQQEINDVIQKGLTAKNDAQLRELERALHPDRMREQPSKWRRN